MWQIPWRPILDGRRSGWCDTRLEGCEALGLTYGLRPFGFNGLTACSTLCGGAASVVDDEATGTSVLWIYKQQVLGSDRCSLNERRRTYFDELELEPNPRNPMMNRYWCFEGNVGK